MSDTRKNLVFQGENQAAERLKFLRSLVEYPEETADTEYKSAVLFDPKSEFGAKLVKHILGQANAGGGYLVIGCREDEHGKLQRDPALNEEIAKSYETTRLCQSVDAFLVRGQRVELQVHKIDLEERVYPVISVQGFKDTPFFCGKEFLASDGRSILKEGVIYIRDQAAKTVIAAGPDQWNKLLKVAIEQRQQEILGQMRVLLEQMGLSVPSSTVAPQKLAAARVLKWVEKEKREAQDNAEKCGMAKAGYVEVVHYLESSGEQWDQAQLLEAARKAKCRNTGWPIGLVLSPPEMAPKPFPEGIRASIYSETMGRSFDYWSIARDGTFFLRRAFYEDGGDAGEPKRLLWFDTRIWTVSEVLLHCLNLYKSLGFPLDALVTIQISHHGLKGRALSAGNQLRAFSLWGRPCEAEEVSWQGNVAIGGIEPNVTALVKDALRDLFMLFDFWEPAEEVWNGVIQEFLKSRV